MARVWRTRRTTEPGHGGSGERGTVHRGGLLAVSDALDPLQGAVASPDELAALLADLGFALDPAAVTSLLQPALGTLPADTQALAQAAQQLAALAPDADAAAVGLAVARVAAAIGPVVADVHALTTTSPPGTMPASRCHQSDAVRGGGPCSWPAWRR